MQAGAGKLTPSAEADLTAQGQKKQRDLQRMSDDLQGDVNNERTEIGKASQQKMAEVVKKLAEEKGYDVVVDATNTVYFKPALDVTAEALAAYNKAYPGAEVGGPEGEAHGRLSRKLRRRRGAAGEAHPPAGDHWRNCGGSGCIC